MSEQLKSKIRSCTACTVRPEATQPVPYFGPVNSPIWFVGRNPGANEDEGGEPFIGKSGNLLDTKWFPALGLERSLVYITNICKCHTTGNRAPTILEYATCRDIWLKAEYQAFKPKMMFLLGNDCTRSMLGQDFQTVSKCYAIPKWCDLWGSQVWLIPIFHPGYLLYNHNPTLMSAVVKSLERLRPQVKEILNANS